MAIGSFSPDSTSSVAPVRSFNRTPLERSTENTAAASVDDTTAPSRTARLGGKPRAIAASATTAAVSTTPTDASIAARASAPRNAA